MTRVAIVGVGNMGRNHAHAVSDHPTLVLDSVVDVDADNAAEVAETYGANRSETDAEPAFERADAAIVATPSHAHLEPAEKALDAGLHLLLEKPVSRDIDAARTFANRCYKTDLVTGVSFILPTSPRTRPSGRRRATATLAMSWPAGRSARFRCPTPGRPVRATTRCST